jgi:hypothetical protein
VPPAFERQRLYFPLRRVFPEAGKLIGIDVLNHPLKLGIETVSGSNLCIPPPSPLGGKTTSKFI